MLLALLVERPNQIERPALSDQIVIELKVEGNAQLAVVGQRPAFQSDPLGADHFRRRQLLTRNENGTVFPFLVLAGGKSCCHVLHFAAQAGGPTQGSSA